MNRELLIAQETLANHYAGSLTVYIKNNELFWRNIRTSHISGNFGFYLAKGKLCFGMHADRADVRLVARALKDADYF